MFNLRSCVSLMLLAAVAPATAQISPVVQERSVLVDAMAFTAGGGSDDDRESAEAVNFGLFNRTVKVSASQPTALARAFALQESSLSSTQVSGRLEATITVSSGAASAAQSDADSSLLFIFDLTAATPIEFRASASLLLRGRNENGEPSDLFGWSRVRLINASTEEAFASINLTGDDAREDASFDGMLPAGRYAILASTKAFAFSPDLLGPPLRSGGGDADLSFSLTVIPAPGAAAVGMAGLLCVARRRRA